MAAAWRTSASVSSSVAGSGCSSSPYSRARSSSGYSGRDGSMRYARSSVSSRAGTRCALASWTRNGPSRRSGRGDTTTSAEFASAIRSESPANATTSDPCNRLLLSSSRQGIVVVSSFIGAAGTAASSSSTRPRRFRNSKRRNISLSSERSGGASTSCVTSQSSSRSRRMVASSFDCLAWSAFSITFLRRAGVRSSACSMTSSTEPYWAISWPAVLSPIPGIPGMLSEVSPLRPMKSGICSGLIP